MPFTTEEFIAVFRNYNTAVFPFQLIIFVAGIIILIIIHKNSSAVNKFIYYFAGFLNLWIGVVYNFIFFTKINKAAFLFGVLFLLQAILLVITAISGKRTGFEINKNPRVYIGYFFMLFGLILYPVINLLLGKSLDSTISLGLPCPTTIFIFGIFLLTETNFPKYLLIIPSLWAILGFSAALSFGVYQDVMLPVTAIAADVILLSGKRQKSFV
jgi:hypothetical protein